MFGPMTWIASWLTATLTRSSGTTVFHFKAATAAWAMVVSVRQNGSLL